MPLADSAFDIVLSTFGVMFTPDQEEAASELLRVCRRVGGRAAAGRAVPCLPPALVLGYSAARWGRNELPAARFMVIPSIP
jgi:ubiquinone/menaquinone biosynthesis C-methylase UbiE